MCDFVTAAIIVSTAVSTVGAIKQGNAQQAAANYQAQVQEQNAKLSESRARDAILRGRIEEQNQRRKTADVAGHQRASQAAGNLALDFGSPLEAAVDTAMLVELDALTIRSNSYREAYDHKVGAYSNRAQAGLSRLEGRNAKTASRYKAAGTLLSGVGKAYGSYSKQSGAFT